MDNNPYRTPQSQVADVAQGGEAERQSLGELYFSFRGRLPRKVYWLYFMLPALVLGILIGFFAAASGENSDPNMALVLLQLALIWPSLAVSVKRWHDRDKSGWWVLISFIPIVGGIWALVENGFLRGTEGENRFGADPTDVY